MKKLLYLTIVCMLFSSCTTIFNKRKTYVEPTIIPNAQTQLMESYRQTLAQRDALSAHISNLTAQMNAAKSSKAKKIGKELVKAQAEYDATVRLLGTFPQSLTNPSYKSENVAKETEQFRKELDRKFEEKRSNVDLDQDILEDITDPELKRAYQNYLKYGEKGTSEEAVNNMKLYYSVQIGTSQRGQAKAYRGVKDVEERRISDTRSIYVAGKFKTEAEARKQCDMIKLNPTYKTAYVIAVYNDKVISLDQARRMPQQ